jgi:hypothetical protein
MQPWPASPSSGPAGWAGPGRVSPRGWGSGLGPGGGWPWMWRCGAGSPPWGRSWSWLGGTLWPLAAPHEVTMGAAATWSATSIGVAPAFGVLGWAVWGAGTGPRTWPAGWSKSACRSTTCSCSCPSWPASPCPGDQHRGCCSGHRGPGHAAVFIALGAAAIQRFRVTFLALGPAHLELRPRGHPGHPSSADPGLAGGHLGRAGRDHGRQRGRGRPRPRPAGPRRQRLWPPEPAPPTGRPRRRRAPGRLALAGAHVGRLGGQLGLGRGIVWFPDVHARLHASTRAALLGVSALLAAAIGGRPAGWRWPWSSSA